MNRAFSACLYAIEFLGMPQAGVITAPLALNEEPFLVADAILQFAEVVRGR